jgi:hypothetical protein
MVANHNCDQGPEPDLNRHTHALHMLVTHIKCITYHLHRKALCPQLVQAPEQVEVVLVDGDEVGVAGGRHAPHRADLNPRLALWARSG